MAGLALLALAQVYFLARTMRPSKSGQTPPSIGSLPSGHPQGGPGGGMGGGPNDGKGPGDGPGPADGPPGSGRSSGDPVRLIVPPNVLFKAIVTMQSDPSAQLSAESLPRMKDLLRQWDDLDKTIATRIQPAMRAGIASLSPSQREFVERQAASIPRGPPALEQLLTLLTARAGDVAASPAASKGGDAYAGVEPEVLVGVLIKLNEDSSLSLTPQQAATLLKPVSEWKVLFDKYIELMGSMTDLLNEPQRGIVMRLKDEPPKEYTTLEEARRALDK